MVSYQIMMVFGLMGRKRHSLPSRLLHKPSGQDRVIFGGRTIYLGPHDSAEALANYARILANIAATGIPDPGISTPKIGELAKRYLKHLAENSHPDSGEPKAIKRAVDAMVAMFADVDASVFGTAKLIQLRDSWAERLCVSTVNKYHTYVVNLFRWAAMTEQVPAEVWHKLKTVPKLKPKQSKARDPKTVKPVPWDVVEKTLPHLSPTLQDVVRIQRLTGMRSGEVLGLTLDQIEDGVYRPRKHKTQRYGHAREVALGPKSLEIIARREPDADGLLFGGYTSASYGRAVTRVCRRLGLPHWHPHQIRHAFATRVRASHGLDAAQAVLGHATARVTEIYAERVGGLAKKVVDEIG